MARGSAFQLMSKTPLSLTHATCKHVYVRKLRKRKGQSANSGKMLGYAKILRLSIIGKLAIRNNSTFKSSLPDTAWVQREHYKWFMPMQTRFKVAIHTIWRANTVRYDLWTSLGWSLTLDSCSLEHPTSCQLVSISTECQLTNVRDPPMLDHEQRW